MLTADLVRARRQRGRLELVPLEGKQRMRAIELARAYIHVAETSIGQTRETFDQACGVIEVGPRDKKLADGIRKMVVDRCDFDVPSEVDAARLRRDVFSRATAQRRALGADEHFSRDAVLRVVGEAHAMTAERLDMMLFADLRAAYRLLSFDRIGSEALVDAYCHAQRQAVLLRAVRVVVEVWFSAPDAARALFRKLKFHRLLYTVERMEEGGYRLTIDGPYSMFGPVTRYGLRLALILPELDRCDRWKLRAELRWGKTREPLVFAEEGARNEVGSPGDADVPLSDDAASLLERFRTRSTRWRASVANVVLDLPGVGVCIPDLVFEHVENGSRVYLELLGYWSRDAVWRRVELVEKGLSERILFAAPKRLRVSAEVLEDSPSSALYVYRGRLSPGAIEEHLDQLAGGSGTAPGSA